MNKKFLPICLLFILSLLLGMGAGIYFINPTPEAEPQNVAKKQDFTPIYTGEEFSKKEEDVTEEKKEEVYKSEQYVVTLSDTKILIYKVAHDGSMQTVEEKKIDIGGIPSEDYGKLYSGIVVKSLEEARQILEDYIS